jgi:UDP-N-acetylmuramoyl-tripeptide--D-alanyl-D-alanine ligase
MITNLMGIGELSHSLNARLVSFSSSSNSGFSSVAVDSRSVKNGGLFFALEGSSCDGHSFVGEAFSAGAQGAVVESSKLKSFNLEDIAQKAGKSLIVVENTLKGLQDSAGVYLEKFPDLLKIGITGSTGKTTTKEITAAIITNEKNVIKNEGNLNSVTGLPISVFNVRPHHQVGIFELGMNHKGEISQIAEVLKPNIAQITNIGRAHIEYFGSIREIVNEKKSIFNFMTNNDIALIPKDDEYADVLADGVRGKVRFYGKDSFEELEETRSLGLEGSEIIWAGEKIHFSLPGKHSLQNALAAIAAAREIHVSNSSIKQGLESVKPLFGRLEVLRLKTNVVRDCYNANPESTAAGIEFCDDLDLQCRRVYVVADMLELGDASFEAHTQLGKRLAASRADMIFLFGRDIEAAASQLAQKNRPFFHTNDIEKLKNALAGYIQEGDLVLLKGSRGCALERLTNTLAGGCNVS